MEGPDDAIWRLKKSAIADAAQKFEKSKKQLGKLGEGRKAHQIDSKASPISKSLFDEAVHKKRF
jgi:hypothetical protein